MQETPGQAVHRSGGLGGLRSRIEARTDYRRLVLVTAAAGLLAAWLAAGIENPTDDTERWPDDTAPPSPAPSQV